MANLELLCSKGFSEVIEGYKGMSIIEKKARYPQPGFRCREALGRCQP